MSPGKTICLVYENFYLAIGYICYENINIKPYFKVRFRAFLSGYSERLNLIVNLLIRLLPI
jgi:hypothetical protein